jgi:kynurenine formamidase
MSKAVCEWLEGCFIKGDGSNLLDLSHDWHEGMTQPHFFPPMIQEPFDTIDKDGVMSFYNHLLESCGTHCEAPAHVLPSAPTIDKIPLSWLLGPAVVINIREKCDGNPHYKLDINDLKGWEMKYGRIPNNAWLVMYSGWAEKWETPGFFDADKDGKDHYPGFDPAAMRWLVENNRHIVGIATECMSPEGGSATRASEQNKKRNMRANKKELDKAAKGDLMTETETIAGKRPTIPVRNELLPAWNTLVLSNLANVAKLPEAGAWIIVGVIPFRRGSGGQARVFGILPDFV